MLETTKNTLPSDETRGSDIRTTWIDRVNSKAKKNAEKKNDLKYLSPAWRQEKKELFE